MLLTVPVLVAASIGFGGAGGITSLASGPDQSSIAASPETLTKSSSIESLTAELPVATPADVRGAERSAAGEGVGGVVGTGAPTDTGSGASPGGGGASGIGVGSTPGGTGNGTDPGTGTPPDPGTAGLDISNLGGSGGQIDQLLQGLNQNK